MLNAIEKQKIETAVSGLDKIADYLGIDGHDDLCVDVAFARLCAKKTLAAVDDESANFWMAKTHATVSAIYNEIKKRHDAGKGVY